jgi:Transposase, Mutator family
MILMEADPGIDENTSRRSFKVGGVGCLQRNGGCSRPCTRGAGGSCRLRSLRQRPGMPKAACADLSSGSSPAWCDFGFSYLHLSHGYSTRLLCRPKPGSNLCRRWPARRGHVTYGRNLPSAVASLDDDFESRIADLRFPLGRRRAIRTTNLLERLFGEARRRNKVIPHACHETAVLKLMYARSFVPSSAGAVSRSPSSSTVS